MILRELKDFTAIFGDFLFFVLFFLFLYYFYIERKEKDLKARFRTFHSKLFVTSLMENLITLLTEKSRWDFTSVSPCPDS